MEKLLNLAKEVGKNFKNFYLAGGTAIALKYRHRVSEDLDFLVKNHSLLRNFLIR